MTGRSLRSLSLPSLLQLLCCGSLAPVTAVAASARVAQLEAKLAESRSALRQAQAELAEALEQDPAQPESVLAHAGVSTCNVRIRSQQPGPAAQYLEHQHQLRAPYYVKSAWRSYQAGLRQKIGEDQSNSDPFIKSHEGLQQLVGALELAPGDASIWLEVGLATAALQSLTEEGGDLSQPAGLLARACRMDPSLLPELSTRLLAKGVSAEVVTTDKDERKLRKKLWKKVVKDWNQTQRVPDIEVRMVPTITDGTCSLRGRAASEVSVNTGSTEVDAAIKSMQMRSIFPTRILQVNIKEHMPDGFLERLSKLCVDKYTAFGKENPKLNPNDLNDRFFGQQITGEDQFDSPEAHRMWPELYKNSKDFKLLRKVISGALRAFTQATGLVTDDSDQDANVILWAAIYPGNGGRHGYHVHQNSISSCVLYVKTAGATTPITFVDPRGAPPVNDYEQHEKERDFEPVVPFHHSEYIFPEPGDLVCFPSWLVHNVPSHWEKDHRVAFAANLQTEFWDAWHRTATGW